MSSIAFRITCTARLARLSALRPRTDNPIIKNALAAAQRAQQLQTQRNARLQQLKCASVDFALVKHSTIELLAVSKDTVDDKDDKAFGKLSTYLERNNTSNLMDEQHPQNIVADDQYLLPLVSSVAFVNADRSLIPQEARHVRLPRPPRRFNTEGSFLKKALIASAFKAEDQSQRIAEEAGFTILDAALTKFDPISLLDVKDDALDDEDDKAFSRLIPQDSTTDANEFTRLNAALKSFDNSPLLDLAFSMITVKII